jgi:hypothetical protein
MSFTSVLDISSIIWDAADYEKNKNRYFDLIDNLPNLFDGITENRARVLLRNELYDEMVNGFPLDKLQGEFRGLAERIYLFLTEIAPQIISFPAALSPPVTSVPNLVKEYYNDTTKEEVAFLLSRIHSGKEVGLTFFTFSYFWTGHGKALQTVEANGNSVEYETIVSDNGSELVRFLENLRRIFEHNPKHDRVLGHRMHRGEPVYPLSCFDGVNNAVPQALLEEGILVGTEYYNYDEENEVYIVFKNHERNLYHGHDEPRLNKISDHIKKHFNKW